MCLRPRKLALAEGIAAGVLFGTAAIFIRFLENLDVFHIAFWRLAVACLFLLVMLIWVRKTVNLDLVRENSKQLSVLGFLLALHFIFFASAVKDTTIMNATVLVNTTPIFSMFVSSFLFQARPSRLAIVGLTISFIGVCVVTYGETAIIGANVHLQGSPSLKGDLEAVLAALVEAFYLNYGRKTCSQMAVLPTMLHIYIVAAVVVAVLGVPATSRVVALPSGEEAIISLVGLGLLPTAAAHTLYFSSLSSLESFETATMALLEPIGATGLGVILFQEWPAPLFIVGASLVLLGIVFVLKEES